MFRKLLPRRPSHTAIVAYLALFLALGGGALAATTPFTGSDGKIHGCVAAKGTLTVLKPPATTCAAGKAKIAWNQTGPRGLQGLRGSQGLQGTKGDAGPGATSIPITNYAAGSNGEVKAINGISIAYSCENGHVSLELASAPFGNTVYISGVGAQDSTLSAVNTTASNSYFSVTGSATANLDVIVTVNGIWNRIDLGGYNGGFANGCNIWGLFIPGT